MSRAGVRSASSSASQRLNCFWASRVVLSMLVMPCSEQRRVVAFGDEGDLVPQVGQPVVDRRGRKHQHAGLDPFLDDLAHQAVVAGLARLVRRLLRKLWDSSMTTRS